jgi:hypothetical protein
MPHSAADETPRRGGTGEDAGQGEGGRTERCQTSLCGEKTEKGTEAMARGDRDEGTAGKTTKRLTSGATLPVGVIASEARDGATDGWGRLVSERERESAGRAGARAREQAGNGPRGGSHGREGGEERPRHGLNSAQQRGEGLFSFYFYFLIPLSIFISFSFEQLILIDNLRC